MTGNKIRMMRAANDGMTQGALAEAIGDGMNAVVVGFIEKGAVLPTKPALELMCQLFQCQKTDLYAAQDIDLLSLMDSAKEDASAACAATRSGRQHDGMTEFRTWLRPNEKAALEHAISELGYRNSAEWFREMYRSTIARNRRLQNRAAVADGTSVAEVL